LRGRWVDATDNRKLTRYIEFLERNTLFAVYLCIRHQFLAKGIHSHHLFDVRHQIGSLTSKSSKMSAGLLRKIFERRLM